MTKDSLQNFIETNGLTHQELYHQTMQIIEPPMKAIAPLFPEKLKQYTLVSPFQSPLLQLFMTIDGDHWGVGLGRNIQDGFAGFGKTIPEALRDLAENIENECY